MVSDGYLWGDDGLALQSFDGWHTVGDQGYLDGGTLHMLGRRSDMIITAGTNVYPHEVELALASVPGVAAAVAAGLADELRGQRVVAGVVPSHGGVTATQLKAGVEDVLSRNKRPLEYFALAELPLTDRGKLSRESAGRLDCPQRPPDPAPWLSTLRGSFPTTGSRSSSPPGAPRSAAPTAP